MFVRRLFEGRHVQELFGAEPRRLISRPSSTWAHVALGLLVAVSAPILATILGTYLLGDVPAVAFILAVIAATAAGRLLAGIPAAILSTILLHYYLIPPTGSFKVTSGVAETLTFGVVALVVAILLDRRDRALEETAVERDRARFLAGVNDVLGSSLNYERTLDQLALQVVPRISDLCWIDVADDEGDIRNVAMAHQDPEMAQLAEELHKRSPIDPKALSGPPNVIRTGRSELTTEIPDELRREPASDGEHLETLRELGVRSAMIVPMAARGTTFGAITLGGAKARQPYDEDDVALAEELADRAAIAIENARLYGERARLAAALQKTLLPAKLPKIPGLELHAYFRPGLDGQEVGGDFYDVFEMGDGSWALVIGDVCGKGPRAAGLSGAARATIRAVGLRTSGPCEILTDLNSTMQPGADSLFCTAGVARLSLGDHKVRATVCAAGHPLPVLLRSDGHWETVGVPGSLLGVHPDPTLVDATADLGPGDALLLYTDGLERRGSHPVLGPDGALGSLPPPSEARASEITRAIQDYVTAIPEDEVMDDIAVLVVRVVDANAFGRS